MFSKQDGTLSFSRITSVILQTSLGSSAVAPCHRIALITDQGELPLTIAYTSGGSTQYEAMAAKIRSVLALSPSASDIVIDSVRASLNHGRMLDAVRRVERLKPQPDPASSPPR